MWALWVTAGVSLAAAGFLAYRSRGRALNDLFFAASLGVLGVLAALLASLGYGALELPAAPVLGALTPLLASLAVVYIVAPRWWRWYGLFVVLGIAAIAAFRQAVMVFHPVAGLILLILPIYAYVRGRAPSPLFLSTSAAAATIGVGGVALAALAAGRAILPPELVLQALPFILLATAVLLAVGAYGAGRR